MAVLNVLPISYADALPWLLRRHYAKRTAPVSFAFGAYIDGALVGIVTYGTPLSSTLRMGICGPEWSGSVLELNRLCCESAPNLASSLIGRSLRQLPRPSIVVSYADTSVGHVGYVYQSTNFLYTGLSAKAKDMKLRGKEHLHNTTIGDISRGRENRAQFMRETYGNDFYLVDRARKHRYVFLHGTKKDRAAMRQALRYPVEPYPKGDTQRYDAGAAFDTQTVLL